MVISMEPMIMIPEGNPGAGGYREHDILVIGKDGVENITKTYLALCILLKFQTMKNISLTFLDGH